MITLPDRPVLDFSGAKACADWAWLCWIEAHPGLASWVQAVGSILAILAAVYVAYLGVREQRLQNWRRERAYLAEIIIVLRWLKLDGESWRRSVVAGGRVLETHLMQERRRSDPFMKNVAKYAEIADERCPDPSLANSIKLLEKWRGDVREAAWQLFRGEIALENTASELGALAKAEIFEEAIGTVLEKARRALKSIS